MISLTAALIGLSAVFFALAAHPFTTYPLSLRLIARLRPCPIQSGIVPKSVALCVCAYNEEQVIRAKLTNMLELQEVFPNLELLLYVDAATDNTAGIVQEFKDLLTCVVGDMRHGKTYGMNTLLRQTSAEIIVFSDANVIFDRYAIGRLIKPFEDNTVGAVCGHLVYSTNNASATAQAGSTYWRLEEKIKSLESDTGSVMGADGSIFAIRRDLHRPPPPDLIDDMFVSLSILVMGYRVVRVSDAFAYEKSVSRASEEFSRKIRIACQAFNVHRTLRHRLRTMKGLDRYKYVSHKLLRWFTIYFLIGSLCCLSLSIITSGYAMLMYIFLISVILFPILLILSPGEKIAKLRDIFGAFLATGIGIWKSFAGERFQTWSPPASTRDFNAKAGNNSESV